MMSACYIESVFYPTFVLPKYGNTFDAYRLIYYIFNNLGGLMLVVLKFKILSSLSLQKNIRNDELWFVRL